MLALVVDNDGFFRELLGEILGDLGYAVITAADGLEALESVTRTPPDIIFLDLVMPKVGGDRVCAYLKSDPATASIPIVILSATVAEDRAKVMGMGADACIAKLRVDELRTHVQAALESLRGGVRAAPPPPGAVFGVERALPRGMVVELLAVKRHHEAILAEIAEGVIEADAAGRVVYVNPAALRLLGRTERETIGQEFPDLLAPAAAAQLREEMGGRQRPGSLPLTVGGRALVLRASPLEDQGQAGGWLLVLQDQTELRQTIQELSVLNRRLQTLDQLRSDLVAMVSHDLRSPLASIRCGLDLLADPRLPPGKREEVLTASRKDADRLGRLASDLLDLVRIEAGKLDLRRVPLGVEAALRLAADRFRAAAAARGLRIQVDLPGTLPPVSADPARLDQVLDNLLSNAVNALGPGGCIRLGAQAALAPQPPEEVPGVELVVADDGPGISAEHLPRIFEKFYRWGSGEGTGLGLYICRALVEAHEGRIAAESTPGVGTRIRFWLPLAPGPPAAP